MQTREELRKLSAGLLHFLATVSFVTMVSAGCSKGGDRTAAPVITKNAAATVTDYKTYSYDTADKLVKNVIYVSAETDGSPVSGSGEIKSYFDSVYDASGRLTRLVRRDGPGPDASWFTPDDDRDYYHAITYDASGKIIRETDYDGPGPDGTWFTADDKVDAGTVFLYDAAGKLSRKITYDDPGADGVWFTGDDRIASYSEISYDTEGRINRETRCYDPGPDKNWFTADDRVGFSTGFSYDDRGNLISEIRYDHPESGNAGSATGDQVGSVVRYTYDANNRWTREVRYYGPGGDGLWFTADDAVLLVKTSTYDASGKQIREDEYNGPGTDGVWFTPDDDAACFTTFDYNANNTLTQQTRYRTANQNGSAPAGSPPAIGVFYFPGWGSQANDWADIQGLPNSRSPGISWPDRVPMLGYYFEDQTPVAEKHIEWAARYGITFFAYDWYWEGNQPLYDWALKAHLRASNRNKLKFSLLWANHGASPTTLKDFDDMVAYWIANYFNQPNFCTIDGKPAVFIFSQEHLDLHAQTFGETAKSLLARANIAAQAAGFTGIYFILTTNARPSDDLETYVLNGGYNAYTGWNYVTSIDTSIISDYSSMVDTYLNFYAAAATTNKKLPYLVPASPGWDARPWQGGAPYVFVRENSTPEKFEMMLIGARSLMDTQSGGPKIIMIEAWNEFGEGSYLEPTRKWDMKYLEALKNVFNAEAP